MIKLKYAFAVLALIPSLAFAQSAVAPNVVTSTNANGANQFQPVGNGSGTSTPMPVTPVGGSGVVTTTPVAPMQKGVSVATATSLTVPATAKAVGAVCTVNVNWEDDGSAPTATVGSGGMGVLANTFFYYSASLAAIQFISQTGTGTCSFSYYK